MHFRVDDLLLGTNVALKPKQNPNVPLITLFQRGQNVSYESMFVSYRSNDPETTGNKKFFIVT